MPKALSPVLDHSSIQEAVDFYRSQNKKIVFTNGCFDLLHIGHVKYLQEARNLGDILIVGVNTDASVRKLKGPHRPIQNEQDRAEILSALKSVSHTILFSEDTPYNLIAKIKPDVLVKGGDWPVSEIVGSDLVLSYKGHVQSLKFIEGRSTTAIIEKSKK